MPITNDSPSIPALATPAALQRFARALEQGRVSADEALAIFDALPAVEVPFMLGAWKGAGFPTGHALDGVLEGYHWHGKRFDSVEHVHPLVFSRRDGSLTYVNPLLTLPSLVQPKRLAHAIELVPALVERMMAGSEPGRALRLLDHPLVRAKAAPYLAANPDALDGLPRFTRRGGPR